MREPIAIVGLACSYPDANSPAELFENVLAGRRAFRRIPEERLSLADYGSTDAGDVDRTYVTQAATIEGYEFDRVRFKIVGSTYRSADLTHWLALDVADRALTDAGFADGDGLPRERTGVILGNTLTGEFSRAQAMRLRWPYVERVLSDTLGDLLPDASARASWLAELESRYKAPFEAFGDESLAGGLANTIAGRICNFFDLKGGGFTVDGACSSSLLAVANACAALAARDLDVAITGGVDLSLDPFELVGFARAGALARDEMRVYDRRAQGFWPGEGCGLLVLMREPDAIERGLRVYARIRGWGIASDGAGGISRPEAAGQVLALRRAYASAGFGPETVACFEGHGTGTEIGDATELEALTQLLRENGAGRDAPASIGSIKANIGHTKAASGAAGLIKATLALHRQLLPPMPGCESPHALVGSGALLRVQTLASPWPQDRPLRAAVSSMGFGGINTHVVLDSQASRRRPALSRRERALQTTKQDTELCLFAEDSAPQLRARVQALLPLSRRISQAELSDLAASLAAEVAARPPGPRARAAVVASRPDELTTQLERLVAAIDRATQNGDAISIEPERGVFFGARSGDPHIGLLFPGQGAPVHPDLGALAPWLDGDPLGSLHAAAIAPAHEAGLFAGSTPIERGEIVDTSLAQPAIVAASVASALMLEALGVVAEVAVGHSLGEIAALAWSGSLTPGASVRLAASRGRIMAELGHDDGAMASLAVDPDTAQRLIATEPCVIAARNGPIRTVIAGDTAAVSRVIERAAAQRIAATRLAVSHAFHSPHVADCAPALAKALSSVPFEAPQRRVVSTRTGLPLGTDADLRLHLVRQVTEPVLFSDAVTRAAVGLDLWIEAGPGRMLGALASDLGDTPVIPLDSGGPTFRGLLAAVGAAFALGAPVDTARLFAHRVTKPFDPERPLSFFSNPCCVDRDPSTVPDAAPGRALPDANDRSVGQSTLDVLRGLVASRCELPVSAIGPDDRFLSDLHLTSIAVSELASRAARELSRPPLVAPNEFADATVAELARAIESEERELVMGSFVAGVDAWVRGFEVVSVARARPRDSAIGGRREGPWSWRTFLEPGDELGEAIAHALRSFAGSDGVLVHLPTTPAFLAQLPRLLEAARAANESLDARHFVLVHHGDASATIARTLHQEARNLASRVIELPPFDIADAAAWVLAEVRAGSAWSEARYDGDGNRFERRLRPLPLGAAAETGLPVGANDVLLVSGGGKGIAAECALALARESGCALGLIGRSRPESDGRAAGEPRALPGRRRPRRLRSRPTSAMRARSASRCARSRRDSGPCADSCTQPGSIDPTCSRFSRSAISATRSHRSSTGSRTCSRRSTRAGCAAWWDSARSSPSSGCPAKPTTRSQTKC